MAKQPDSQLTPVSSRALNLGYAVANPKKVFPAASRASAMADALTKASLKADLPQKSGKKNDSGSVSATIKRAK